MCNQKSPVSLAILSLFEAVGLLRCHILGVMVRLLGSKDDAMLVCKYDPFTATIALPSRGILP